MLRICLLGDLAVTRDGKPLDHLGPQQRRLLARLTLTAGKPLESERLRSELWPESDLDTVRHSLRRLREILGAEDGHRLTWEKGIVCLNLKGVSVDIYEFTVLVKQNTPEALDAALQLYRGDLLKDWNDPWIEAEVRDDLKISCLDALKTRAKRALSGGDHAGAARYLRRFVNGCPEMDWGWQTLLETYRAMGSRPRVLETYQHYVDYLRRESRLQQIALKPAEAIERIVREVVHQEQEQARQDLEIVAAPSSPPASAPSSPPIESVGGAVPLHSSFYIERPEDAEVYEALRRREATILIKGARQIGKSSLLARALHLARQQEAQILLTDWQTLAHSDLASAEMFFLSLAQMLSDQLGLDTRPETEFDPRRAPAAGFERFVRRQVFASRDGPIVWGIDEADRIFACDFRNDVFGKFRAWHNERALDPEGPWGRLTLVLAYSTEASLFIKNINQSPFNVGTRVTLNDLTPAQILDLNQRYGGPLAQNEVEQLMALVGGHPYLARRCLYTLQKQKCQLAELIEQAENGDGIFTDHLERMRFALRLDPELAEAVRLYFAEETPPQEEHFTRLCAAGIITGRSPAGMRPRCRLYEHYLRRQLL